MEEIRFQRARTLIVRNDEILHFGQLIQSVFITGRQKGIYFQTLKDPAIVIVLKLSLFITIFRNQALLGFSPV